WRLEVDLAADGGHADRVPVMPDPGDRPVEQVAHAVARARAGEFAEAQRVQDGDRTRADREDVAQDAADPGGGALERLDGARMVVGLDLEGTHEPGADVDRDGVLPGASDDGRTLRWERAHDALGVLVGAVRVTQQR